LQVEDSQKDMADGIKEEKKKNPKSSFVQSHHQLPLQNRKKRKISN